MKSIIYKLSFLFLPAIFSVPAFAQTKASATQASQVDYTSIVMILMLVISVLILTIALYLLYLIRLMLSKEAALTGKSTTRDEVKVWAQFSAKMTRAVPIEEEESILLDHNYDGIRELDNHLPPWWKGLFYFTIVFGVIYLFVYHIIKPEWAPLQDDAYVMEVASFEERLSQMANFIDENNVQLTVITDDLANGKNIFVSNCAACHRPDGGGSIGPNLTDEYWIHGNSIQDVFKVVKYGVAGKMVPWQSTLSGKEIRDVTSYVLTSLVGSNPENPREPEGEFLAPEPRIETDSARIAQKPVAALFK